MKSGYVGALRNLPRWGLQGDGGLAAPILLGCPLSTSLRGSFCAGGIQLLYFWDGAQSLVDMILLSRPNIPTFHEKWVCYTAPNLPCLPIQTAADGDKFGCWSG